jgi:hypothetical protein
MEDGDWKMENGKWKVASLESLPAGHKGPEHGADLLVANGESLVLVG